MTRPSTVAAFAPDTADVAVHIAVARILDAGGVDALILPDRSWDPFTLLAALVPRTTRIGLIAGAATGPNAPFTVARKLASLDHLSHGRAGWLADGGPEPAGRAEEFVAVVRALWDSFADDAVVRDVDAGRYYDPTGLHPPHHDGPHFRVRGPLNISRPPQGHPVLVAPADAAVAPFADVVLARPGERATGRVWQVLDTTSAEVIAAVRADGVVLSVSDVDAAEHLVHDVLPRLDGRPDTTATTLRDRLGLARPEAVWA